MNPGVYITLRSSDPIRANKDLRLGTASPSNSRYLGSYYGLYITIL